MNCSSSIHYHHPHSVVLTHSPLHAPPAGEEALSRLLHEKSGNALGPAPPHRRQATISSRSPVPTGVVPTRAYGFSPPTVSRKRQGIILRMAGIQTTSRE